MKSIVPESVTAYKISWYSSIPTSRGFFECNISRALNEPDFFPSAPNQSGRDSQRTKIRIATTEIIVAIPPK